MRLEIVEAVCETGGAHNEDAWGQADGAVWVLDGATGIGDRPHIASPSDAAWFVGAVNRALSAEFAAGQSAGHAIAASARAAADAARRIASIDHLEAYELPCASLTLVQALGDDALEFANLGDCRLVWSFAGGAAQPYGTSGVTALDARMERRIAEELARGVPPDEVRIASKAMAREHRKLINTPEGYWILDLTGAGTPHTERTVLRTDQPVDLLLMSDGFSRLTDLYGVHDHDSLLRAARTHGLAALYDQLRDIEAADPECRTYARHKARDDATAVLLRFD
ncbi:protein phosphatase 2C domain-containing protein [Phenylobacterium aquaticum]|uniref:protein phosphatase 2C domain-containing protein n=1 Tax=Phenylobacterium aquaticum TaxID=1763816 RepID=UPI001F5E2B9F|nr:protein phosphatase 2C domain-containing protein [Phenylobacterium aquaticum]MCI3134096.1 protein phosphatase 2C domain-containing protein [Phenylobacterium aquaticum]